MLGMFPFMDEPFFRESAWFWRKRPGGGVERAVTARGGTEQGTPAITASPVSFVQFWLNPGPISLRSEPVYVVSNKSCSGMYESRPNESLLQTLHRVCGVPADRPPLGWRGWLVGRIVRRDGGGARRYFVTSSQLVLWGSHGTVKPGDLVVLFDDSFCPQGERCQMVAGEVLEPGVMKGDVRIVSREEPINALCDHATALQTACSGVHWLLSGKSTEASATLFSYVGGIPPDEPGVYVHFIDALDAKWSCGLTP
jgi:hypothetical protein